MVGLPMIDTVHNVVYRILYIVKILNKNDSVCTRQKAPPASNTQHRTSYTQAK